MTEPAVTEPAVPAGKRPRKGKFSQRVEYLLYRGLLGVMGRVSQPRAQRWGPRLGRFASMVLPRRTKLAKKNVLRAYPDLSSNERDAIVKRCWEHFGWITLQYLQVQTRTLEEVAASCTYEGRDELERVVGLGRGVLMLSAHFGSWEMGGLLLGTFADDVSTVARKLDNPLLERDLARSRSRDRVTYIDRRRAAGPLMKALERKGAVMLLTDQAVKPREGILVPFLGSPAWTTTAPARLSLRFGAPILFVFCVPDGPGIRISFESTIDPERLQPEERTTEWITSRMNDVLSARIRQSPHYWLWMHDRWKGTSGL